MMGRLNKFRLRKWKRWKRRGKHPSENTQSNIAIRGGKTTDEVSKVSRMKSLWALWICEFKSQICSKPCSLQLPKTCPNHEIAHHCLVLCSCVCIQGSWLIRRTVSALAADCCSVVPYLHLPLWQSCAHILKVPGPGTWDIVQVPSWKHCYCSEKDAVTVGNTWRPVFTNEI